MGHFYARPQGPGLRQSQCREEKREKVEGEKTLTNNLQREKAVEEKRQGGAGIDKGAC